MLQVAAPDSDFFRAEGPVFTKGGVAVAAAALSVDYAEQPIRIVQRDGQDNTTDVGALVERAILLRLGASLAPFPWLRLDVQAPFALYEGTTLPNGGVFGGQSVVAPASPALGDLRLGLHFRPIRAEAFQLILGGHYWAPTGFTSAYLSDGRFRAEADLGIAGRAGVLQYGCTFSVAPMFFAARDGDRVAASCGLHARVGSVVSLGIEPSFALVRDIRDVPGAPAKDLMLYSFEPLAAFRIQTGGFFVGLAAGPGIGDAPGTGIFRGMFQIGYRVDGEQQKPAGPAPQSKDIDMDGIPNDADKCPEEAGPESSDAARNGCPTHDVDADLIVDEEDACPSQAGTRHADPKANGCPDSDNDYLPDPIDKCKTEPGSDASGCPLYARLVKNAFQVTPALVFNGNETGLSKQARSALEEIAATMRANPKIGHVSFLLGTKGAAGAVSDKRAEQITLTIRGANVDSQRFEVVLSDTVKSGAVEVKVER